MNLISYAITTNHILAKYQPYLEKFNPSLQTIQAIIAIFEFTESCDVLNSEKSVGSPSTQIPLCGFITMRAASWVASASFNIEPAQDKIHIHGISKKGFISYNLIPVDDIPRIKATITNIIKKAKEAV